MTKLTNLKQLSIQSAAIRVKMADKQTDRHTHTHTHTHRADGYPRTDIMFAFDV